MRKPLDNFLKYLNNNNMRDFSKIYKENLDIVGKKAVELGELTRLGIPIPDGFVITTSFFKKFLQETELDLKIKKIEGLMHPAIEDSKAKLFEPIKKEIIRTHIPQNLSNELQKFYRKLSGILKEQSLNIYSSSKNSRSIIFHNIKGDTNLILKIKEIWASNINKPVAIIVQKNINSKIKGTMITNNPPKELGYIAQKIQKHFYFPQEVDYVIEKGKIYITLVKPFTGIIEKSYLKVFQKKIQKVLIKATSINPGIVTGVVKIVSLNHKNFKIKRDEIAIVPKLNVKLYENIKKAKGIVVDTILPNSRALMLYRKDIKIPTIIGAKNATKILQNCNIVTINGMSGEVYQGGFA